MYVFKLCIIKLTWSIYNNCSKDSITQNFPASEKTTKTYL